MKLLIASDLHGSEYYTRLLLERHAHERADRLILLGDLLYHGPRNDLPRDYDTKKTTALLNAQEKKPLCVRGNCDGEVDQMVLDFPILADFAAVMSGERLLYLTHGHHLEDAAENVAPGDVILYGHTHVPDFTLRDGVYFINPGSVSIPKGGSPHSYILFDDGVFRWKDVLTGNTWREESMG